MLPPHSLGAKLNERCLIVDKTAEAEEKTDEASDIITLIDENKDAAYHGLCHSLSVFLSDINRWTSYVLYSYV